MDDFTALEIVMSGDGAFTDKIQGRPCQPGLLEAITILERGMASGRPSIGLLVRNNDGTVTIAETSWALLDSACLAFRARYGSGAGL